MQKQPERVRRWFLLLAVQRRHSREGKSTGGTHGTRAQMSRSSPGKTKVPWMRGQKQVLGHQGSPKLLGTSQLDDSCGGLFYIYLGANILNLLRFYSGEYDSV